MNGLANRNKTLGELRTELRARLGFVTKGPAAKTNQEVLDSFLSEAYDTVWDLLDPSSMRKVCVINLVAGSYLYDWNNDAEDEPIDPGRVISVLVEVSETVREPLRQGINVRSREDATRTQPCRYDNLNGQLEIYPIPNRAYPLIVEYTAARARFTQDSDRPSVPSRLIFQYALSLGKAHYRHPDAEVAGKTFERMVATYRTRQHENRRYFVGRTEESPGQVVRTADGYVLR
ncbi:hypothetical protein RBI22_15190 [Alcaligenaceae bacterium C4P045]|nr:hypothetical protein [Alcaligenaceae bacterium C4P045]